jgi:hypothetical protein
VRQREVLQSAGLLTIQMLISTLDPSRAGTKRDEIVITTGVEVGGMLCDGLGDGVMVECPTEDLEFLRNMSFGLLQGRPRAEFQEG